VVLLCLFLQTRICLLHSALPRALPLPCPVPRRAVRFRPPHRTPSPVGYAHAPLHLVCRGPSVTRPPPTRRHQLEVVAGEDIVCCG
jgi:hypothetical protein